ncbi:MAG: hypothetical protein EAY75_02685 [Bacteroidetes bacterium]|nr:MAG: hypothetical protein EAY75_02685 [Bacteroidota bacterium]
MLGGSEKKTVSPKFSGFTLPQLVLYGIARFGIRLKKSNLIGKMFACSSKKFSHIAVEALFLAFHGR